MVSALMTCLSRPPSRRKKPVCSLCWTFASASEQGLARVPLKSNLRDLGDAVEIAEHGFENARRDLKPTQVEQRKHD